MADQVISTISECVRSVSCPGGCQEQCGVEQEQGCGDGSSMQSPRGSTQEWEEMATQASITDECVRSVACPGECQGICKMEICLKITGSSIMQEDQGSAQDMQCSLKSKPNTQSLGCQRVIIFWNHTLDEWVGL